MEPHFPNHSRKVQTKCFTWNCTLKIIRLFGAKIQIIFGRPCRHTWWILRTRSTSGSSNLRLGFVPSGKSSGFAKVWKIKIFLSSEKQYWDLTHYWIHLLYFTEQWENVIFELIICCIYFISNCLKNYIFIAFLDFQSCL